MSDEVFVIRNQLSQFWARSGEWVDGREPQRLLKIKHQDEAINQLVELSAKDIELRGEVLSCSLNDKNEPEVEASPNLTPTLADRSAERAAQRSEEKATEAARLAAANEDREPEDNEESPEQADSEAKEPPVGAAV